MYEPTGITLDSKYLNMKVTNTLTLAEAACIELRSYAPSLVTLPTKPSRYVIA